MAIINSELKHSIDDWQNLGKYIFFNQINQKIFIVDYGDLNSEANETIFLIHGYPESSYSYSKIIPYLEKRFKRIILFDFIGFGFSSKPKDYNYSIFNMADTVSLVWKKLDLKGAHMLAHDMGSTVLLEVLFRQECNLLPNYISNKIISTTFTNSNMFIELGKITFGQSLLLSPFRSIFIKFNSFKFFKNQIYSADGTRNLKLSDIENLWALVKYNNGNLIMHQLIQYYTDRVKYQNNRWYFNPDIYKEIPVHIVWGEKDKVAPLSIPNELKKSIFKHAKLSVIKNIGHFGQISSPKEWSEAVLSFY